MYEMLYSLQRAHIVDDIVPYICLVHTIANFENTHKQLYTIPYMYKYLLGAHVLLTNPTE